MALCAPAGADIFGPFALASESAIPGYPYNQQVEYAHDPAISGDARYVGFDGSFGGVTGVWRRDLKSGAVEAVAVGEPGTAAGSAELPSISEDGRYVSFTSTAALSPDDHNVGPDVYVRDMSLEASQAGAFTLASAVNGSGEGLRYQTGEPARFGSLAGGRSALSSDGRKVAFVTSAVSNLVPYPELEQREREEGRTPQPHTPSLQVAVRDLDAKSTQLVSAAYPPTGQPRPVSATEGGSTFGAAYAEGGAPPFKPIESYGQSPWFGASISGDGSTVAWLGQDVGEQAQILPAESLSPRYAEPLWRRIADGPLAPTRRITGGSDPANPECAGSGETAVSQNSPSPSDPCQGPFATFNDPSSPGSWAGGIGDPIPRLSADGYTVAFLANAPLLAAGSNFGRGASNSDLYVADMHPGLTRVQALRPLTELASGDITDLATDAPIIDLGISPNASLSRGAGGSSDHGAVAFTTKRTVFPLGSPAYVSPAAAVPGMVEQFDVDLADDTLTRVTKGFEGGPSEHPHAPKPPGEDPYNQVADGALSPSFSGDGNMLSLSSTAANLVYGDGNTPPLGNESKLFDGGDAFVVSRVLFGATSTETYVTPPPASPALVPLWSLGVTAFSRRDGSVLLEVDVPGAGALRTSANAAVRVAVASTAHAGRRRGRRRHARAKLATRTVASQDVASSTGGLVTLILKLAPRYSTLAGQKGGLSATVNLMFSAPGHSSLHQGVAVSFVRTARARRHSGHAARHRRPARGGHR
jgi:hypothetical protein